MSVHIPQAQNQAVRHGDRRHVASIARQRQHVVASSREQAASVAVVVRKRLADSQPLPKLNEYNLSDDVWAELCSILTSAELAEVNIASAGAIIDMYDPAPEQVPDVVPRHTASWRDEHPVLTHHLQWVNADGCQHGLTIRCDSLDDLVRQLTQVKALIATAKTKANAQRTQEPRIDAEPVLSSRRCELHDTPMYKAVSKKTGKPYASHMTADGERCFGHKKG